MARISVKYPIGSKVRTKHRAGIEGIVTAIFIRGRGRSYEFSYVHEGTPTSVTVEESEIEAFRGGEPFGF